MSGGGGVPRGIVPSGQKRTGDLRLVITIILPAMHVDPLILGHDDGAGLRRYLYMKLPHDCLLPLDTVPLSNIGLILMVLNETEGLLNFP